MKIPDAKAAVEKQWENLRKYWHFCFWWKLEKWGDRWSKEWGQKNCTPCIVNGSLSPQEFGCGAAVSKIQRSSRTPRWHCERWLRIVCSIHWTGIISITNDRCKSNGYKKRLPGCAGQAADAESAYTQVKREDAPSLLKIPKSECPDVWTSLTKHKWPKSWSSMEDPVVLLERNLYGHLSAGLSWEREFEKVLLEHGWEKARCWECLFVNREKTSSCLLVWTISNWLEGNCPSTRHRSLVSFFWVALNENVKQAKIMSTMTKICLNPKSLLERQKSYLTLRNFAQTYPHGPMTLKGMQSNAWNILRIGE